MSVDIASLVLAVDSTSVDKGSVSLDKLAQSGDEAAISAQSLAKAGAAMVLALTAAAAATVVLVRNSINAADAMNDMHLKTGLAFKDLAAYDLLARQSGSSLEGVAQGFKFLGKSMTDNRKELEQLGVTSKDTNVAMGQFADLISSINDPALKTTVAMKYLGRAGVELIPTLSGGSAAFEKARQDTANYGAALEKAAPTADAFNDEMAKLTIHVAAAAQTLVVQLLPLMTALAEDTSGAADEVKILGSSFSPLVETMRAVVVFGGNVAFVMRGMGTEIGGIAAQLAALDRGDFAAFSAIGEEMKKDAAAARVEFDKWEKKILDVGAAAEKAASGVKKLTKEEEEAIRTAEERGKAAKKSVDQYAAIIKASNDFVESLKKEVETFGMSDEAKKRYEATTISLTLHKGKERDAFLASTDALIKEKQAKEDAAAAARIHNATVTQFFEDEENERKSIEGGVKAIREKIEKLNEETAALTMTAVQLREHIVLREMEKSGLDKSKEAYAEMESRYRSALSANEMTKQAKKGADEAARAWDKFADDISRSLTDSLMRGFEEGKPFAQNFLDSLQATFKTTVLKIAVQMVMDPITGGIKGLLGGIGGGSTGLFGNSGSLMDTLSAGGSLYNLATGNVAGGMYGAFAGSSMGASLGLSVPGLMGPTTSGAALSGLTGLGTAIPYIGLALGAASMLGMFEGDGIAERTAQVSQSGWNGDGYGYQSDIGQFSPYSRNRWFSGEMGPTQDALAQQITALDNKLAAVMTGDQLTAAQAALQADPISTVGFGPEHTDWQQSGAAEFIMTERYMLILNAMQSGLGDLAAQGGITANEVENAIAGIQAAKQAEIDAKEAVTAAAEKTAADQLAAQKKIAEGWQRVADSILDTINKLRGEMGTPRQNFAQAQADFFINTAAARAGSQASAKNLPQLANAVVSLGRAVSVTSADQAMLTARTIASLQSTVQGMAQFGISLPSFDVGTDYVPMDMIARIHEGEEIIPKRNRGGSNNADLIAELRALRSEVAALRSSSGSIQKDTRRTSDILQRVTRDGNSLLTEVVV